MSDRARAQGFEALTDIAYAGASAAQTLDLYLPARGRPAVPLVIDIHGGAFRGGDKADPDITSNVPALLAHGYAVASINYRLSGEARFPAGVQDAKAAVRWLRANAARYGIDPARFATWGESAGGYLASMVGVTGHRPVLDDPTLGSPGVSNAVQAVVSLYGPSNFATMDSQLALVSGCTADDLTHSAAGSPESVWLGAPLRRAPDLEASSVTGWVASAAEGTLPAFFLAHGDGDRIVPVGQSLELAEALRRVGAAVTLEVVPGAGHGAEAVTLGSQDGAIAFLGRALTPAP